MLATRVPLHSGDGTPSFVLDNAIALSGDFNITILAPRVRGSTPVVVQQGVTVKRFPYFPARWERLADDAIMPQLGANRWLYAQAVSLAVRMIWVALREFRTERRADVLHAHWVFPAGLACFILNVAFGAPFLVSSHGADAFRLNRGPFRYINRAVLARSARLVGASKEIIEQFGEIGCEVAVQPTGVDFSLWSALVPNRAPEPGRVLFIGRLAEKKGVADGIRAVARIDGATLRVVGDGPLAAQLKDIALLAGAQDRVTFLGKLTREQVATELRSALCLIIPSITAADGDRDGTPNVLGEAIASGVPVVASQIAGLAEYIVDGETGMLHEPGDVDEIAACIQSLMNSAEDCERLPEQARSRLQTQLDISAIVETYSCWYWDAINSTSGAPDAGERT